MKLAKLLSTDQIILDMKAVGHWPAITELVAQLVKSRRLPPGQQKPMLAALKSMDTPPATATE